MKTKMMKTTESTDGTTHNRSPIPPTQFRAQATGVGNTRAVSAATGGMRALRVRDCMSPETVRMLPKDSGYPAPTEPVPGFEDSSY